MVYYADLLNILFFSIQTDKFEGCTFNITVYRGDRFAIESQTGAWRLNKIIHFVPFEPGTTDRSKPAEFISTVRGLKNMISSLRAGKLPPIRRWQT